MRKLTKEEWAIRNHNRKLVKFLLILLIIDLAIVVVAFIFDNIALGTNGGSFAIACALIALWVVTHHPEIEIPKKPC